MIKILPVCLLIFLVSCQNNKDKVSEIVGLQLYENERNSFFNNMETVKNAAAELQATGAEFNGSLLTNPSHYSQYVGDSIKSAANLGLYLSDLNYCVIYGESRAAKELFSSAIALSKAIGVDKSVLEFLMDRYNENISLRDSVMMLVNDLYEKSTTGLRNTSRNRLLGVAMAAYQIETLHLALGVIETYPKDILPEDLRIQILIPLFQFVLNQQKSIETIYAFLRTLGNASDPSRTPNFYHYDRAFKELIALYRQLHADDAIANNRGAELLNDNVVNELRSKVNAIREKIISTEV